MYAQCYFRIINRDVLSSDPTWVTIMIGKVCVGVIALVAKESISRFFPGALLRALPAPQDRGWQLNVAPLSETLCCIVVNDRPAGVIGPTIVLPRRSDPDPDPGASQIGIVTWVPSHADT